MAQFVLKLPSEVNNLYTDIIAQIGIDNMGAITIYLLDELLKELKRVHSEKGDKGIDAYTEYILNSLYDLEKKKKWGIKKFRNLDRPE